jgi:hypothetical protein
MASSGGPNPVATPSRSRETTLRGGDPGAIAAGLGAALLFVSLFLHWYAPGLTAWTVFEVWDLVLAALALWTLVMAAGRLGLGERRPDGWLLTPAVAAVVLVVAALINHPPAAIGRSPEVGSWLALVASLVMVAGSALSVARITVAVELDDGRSARARRRPLRPARAHTRSAPTDTTRVIAGDPDGPPPPARG